MIDESTTNSQITDSVTQSNTTVIGQAPASTQGLLDTVMAETIGMSMHNAVTAQQNSQMMGNAAVAATCARLLKAPVVLDADGAGPPTPLTLTEILRALDAAIFANQTLLSSEGLYDRELEDFEKALRRNLDSLRAARSTLAGVSETPPALDAILKLLNAEIEGQLAMLGDAQQKLNQIVASPPDAGEIAALNKLGAALDRSSANIDSFSNVLNQLNSA